jgi:hypothetical protein
MKRLDAAGRCCGLDVEFFGRTHAFCPVCRATFDARSGLQIENTFWQERAPGVFVRFGEDVRDEPVSQAR